MTLHQLYIASGFYQGKIHPNIDKIAIVKNLNKFKSNCNLQMQDVKPFLCCIMIYKINPHESYLMIP